mmetsp:Transcript_24642/g.68583  ORF Transcript_24642/g.68583 Transcript_24642/m.68583 type:complete len:105 (+) Transcript_24642:3750-4064(+)
MCLGPLSSWASLFSFCAPFTPAQPPFLTVIHDNAPTTACPQPPAPHGSGGQVCHTLLAAAVWNSIATAAGLGQLVSSGRRGRGATQPVLPPELLQIQQPHRQPG